MAGTVVEALGNALKKAAGGAPNDFLEVYKMFGAAKNKAVKDELRPLVKQAFKENPKATYEEIVNAVKNNPKYVAPPTLSTINSNVDAKLINKEAKESLEIQLKNQRRVDNIAPPGRIDDAAYGKWLENNASYEGSATQAWEQNQQVIKEESEKYFNEKRQAFKDKIASIKEKRKNAPKSEKPKLKTLDEAIDEEYERKLEKLRQEGIGRHDPAPAGIAPPEKIEQKTVASAPSVQLNFEPGSMSTMATMARANNVEKQNILNNVQSKLKDVMVKEEKEAFKSGESLLNKSQDEAMSWSRGAKVALGTAVTGAALCAALSSSRGQQNNAQLYGQQPLY